MTDETCLGAVPQDEHSAPCPHCTLVDTGQAAATTATDADPAEGVPQAAGPERGTQRRPLLVRAAEHGVPPSGPCCFLGARCEVFGPTGRALQGPPL